jgi:putative ABC transport system ATP-binding protein
MVGGLDKPTEGGVRIDGKLLSDLPDNQVTEMRRRRMGFVFQFYNLIPVLTALENAALPLMLDGMAKGKANAKAQDWLKRVGLDSRLGNRPDQLSGGQQQRVAIARALVAEPVLVMTDEPTGNLDTRAADEIAALLRQVASEWGRSVLMVTHEPRIAAYADRIIFLKDGKIVEETRMKGDRAGDAANLRARMEAL